MEDITHKIVANIGQPEDDQKDIVDTEENNQHIAHDASQDEQKREIPEETEAQKSWRELREQAEEGKRAKKELEEAYKLLRLIEQHSKNNKEQATQSAAPDEELNIDALPDEEYTDNRQLKKILKKYRSDYDKLIKEIEISKKQSYQSRVEATIRQEFPDYQEVVSHDNVEKLRQLKPHIFKSLSYNPDLYEQAVGAYEAIKEFGIYKPKDFDRDQYQFKNNINKPRSAATMSAQQKKSSLDDLSRYNNPSAEDLKAFYEDALKKSGRSSAYNT